MLSMFFDQIASGAGFMPHGMCYLWQPDILALHVISDGVITLSYLTIPLTLVYFVRKRADLQYHWMFLCFATFIIACAATHLMEIWTIWHPAYWLSGGIKAATALASVVTAILLAKVLPSVLRLPSPAALKHANLQLEKEASERMRSEDNLRRVNVQLEVQAAERTELADERFRLAIDAAPTGMLLMDSSGLIVLVNAQIESVFGYSRAELLGQRIEMLVPERFRGNHPGFRAEFFRSPKARAMGAGRDLYGLRKDGSEVPVEIGLNPLHTSAGEFVLGSIVDLSRRRELDRMRADFVSTVSHELRTPLTSISGSLGLLQAGALGVLPAGATEMVRIAYKNSGRLVRIINDILDIGKLEAGQLTLHSLSIPLARLLQQTVEANGAFAEKCEVRFCLDAGSDDDCVMADPDRLIQVLTNLLSNAAKFSDPGGTVQIRVLPKPTTLRIEVEDFGPGIPEEFRGRLFEKFAQADSSTARLFEGSGLGLSIARNLVEAMGGTIGYSSVVGRGSIFHIELPRAMAPAMAPENSMPPGAILPPPYLSPKSVPAAVEDGALPRLLHIEDDGDLRAVIRAILVGRAQVIPACDLRDAERALCEEKVELVVLDVLLPDGNGIGLIDKIAETAGPKIPIIVLSVGDVPAAVRRKVAAVLVKSQASASEIAATIMFHLPPRRP